MTNCNSQLKFIINFFKWFPVVFITSIIAWSYFAYIFALCIYFVENIFERIILLVFYHSILLIFIWSYVQTIFTKPSKPPNEYFLNIKEMDSFILLNDYESKSKLLEQIIEQKELTAICRNANGSVRFCDICCCIKPDRSHHCSSCDSCILKMDHHCPWVNNCVGFHNYKYFVLFLIHGIIYCAYILLSSCRYFINYWKSQSKIDNHILGFNLVFLFLVAFLFMVALMSLGGYHIFLVLKNQTTLESFRRPYLAGSSSPVNEIFNLGIRSNFCQVFGEMAKYWCFPVATNKGDGIVFQTRHFRQVEFRSLVDEV